jgi:hypothetical protein
MRVLVIDNNSDHMEQLIKIAVNSDISLIYLLRAYQDQVLHVNGTGPSIRSDICFDLIPKKEERSEPVNKKNHSWKAVKERNKFFNKR